MYRRVHLPTNAARLLGSALALAGLSMLGAGAAGSRAATPVRVSAGHATVLSFPNVCEAEITSGRQVLRVDVLSPTAVRVSAVRPGQGALRVRTAGGWETYPVRAEAAPRGAAGRYLALASTDAWLGSLWHALTSVAKPTQPERPDLAAGPHSRGRYRPANRAAYPQVSVAARAGAPARILPTPRPSVSGRVVAIPPTGAAAGVGSQPPAWQPAFHGQAAPAPEPAPETPFMPVARVLDPLLSLVSARRVAMAPEAGRSAVPVAVREIPGLPRVAEGPSGVPIRVSLVEGKSRILPAQGVKTIQIDDPTGSIADVQPVSENEVLILAKGPGTTTLRIWDRRGRTDYEVTAEPNETRRQETIQEAIGIQGVKVRVAESVAILDGQVTSLDQLVRAQKIAEAFVAKVVNNLSVPPPPAAGPVQPPASEGVQAVLPPGITADSLPGQPNIVVLRGLVPRLEDLRGVEDLVQKMVQHNNGTVVNLLQLAPPRQVRVQARMVNADEHFLHDLGIQWSEQITIGTPLVQTTTTGATSSKTMPPLPDSTFRLLTPIQATIKTALQDSRAEVLASPSILVNSGSCGFIQVGGEVPIPVVVTGFASAGNGAAAGGGGGGGNQGGVGTIGQSVMFRPFGVLLTIEPVVEPENKITLRLLAEVSAVDRDSAVVVGGSPIPGFSTKRATAELTLKAGETLVIGGLISREEAKAVQKFPILADIPVLGAFFRSVRKEKQSRELVLFLTPELLPGPEPPAGLRQYPALRPAATPPAGTVGGGLGLSPSFGGAGGVATGTAGR